MVLTVFMAALRASNRPVHRTVDSLCRHAAMVVRDLGAQLWKTSRFRCIRSADQQRLCPPAVRSRKTPPWEAVLERESYPHLAGHVPLPGQSHEWGRQHAFAAAIAASENGLIEVSKLVSR